MADIRTLPVDAGLPPIGSCLERLFRLLGAQHTTNLARSVNAGVHSLRARLDEVRESIARAAEHSGRNPRLIRLVGVVKGVGEDAIRQAVSAGLGDLAESRVQAAETAIASVGRDVQWHMVGHLQRNKVSRAVALFDRVHSVDGLELARLISRRAVEGGRPMPILIQVNVSREATKHGVAPDGLEPLIEEVAGLPGVILDGLMSMGPPVESGEEARPYFARTRELRDGVARALGLELPQLSMGMSTDYEVAIEEGSTMVRVGQALFGPRGRQMR